MTIDDRTQELLALRIGMLLIQSARLQAENEALAAVKATAGDGATVASGGAEQRTGQEPT